MKRTWSLLALVFLLAVLPGGGRLQAQERPNILFAFADDWGYPHANVYGDRTVETPTFERVAAEGVLFDRAFVSAPSCTPSRGAVLTGQDFWRLGTGANLFSRFPEELAVYPSLLADEAGYTVGYTRKGWGPGRIGDRPHNPAGPHFDNFEQFLEERPEGQPFAFWFGSYDPHRSYGDSLREAMGIDPQEVTVPPMFPDHPAVRGDIANYYAEVQRFDREVGRLLERLEERGALENTIVVVAGDHGWPFPRGKTNLYDMGTHVPLAIRWPEVVAAPGRRTDAFVNLTDLAPTFMKAAGLAVPDEMTGQSLMDLLRETPAATEAAPAYGDGRRAVVVGRERHVQAQEAPNTGGYPMRAIRTAEYLYIRNYHPDRWPAGTPHFERSYRDDAWLGDVDNGPTKYVMWARRASSSHAQQLYDLAFGKRPFEELYDLRIDPHQMHDVAADPDYAEAKRRLARRLTRELRRRGDPRATGENVALDQGSYRGGITTWPGRDTIEPYEQE